MRYDSRVRNKPPDMGSASTPFSMSPGHSSGRLCARCQQPCFDQRGSSMQRVCGVRQWVGKCCAATAPTGGA